MRKYWKYGFQLQVHQSPLWHLLSPQKYVYKHLHLTESHQIEILLCEVDQLIPLQYLIGNNQNELRESAFAIGYNNLQKSDFRKQ